MSFHTCYSICVEILGIVSVEVTIFYYLQITCHKKSGVMFQIKREKEAVENIHWSLSQGTSMFTIKGMKKIVNLYGGVIGIVAQKISPNVWPDVGQLVPISPSL